MVDEHWLPIVGWEPFYQISSRGRVRTVERTVACVNPRGGWCSRVLPSMTLKPKKNRRGHLRVMLKVAGRRKHAYIHVLVAEHFLGPRPAGLLVCHRDDEKRNNRLENLYYGTRSENAQDAIRNGRWRRKLRAKLPGKHFRKHEKTPEKPKASVKIDI